VLNINVWCTTLSPVRCITTSRGFAHLEEELLLEELDDELLLEDEDDELLLLLELLDDDDELDDDELLLLELLEDDDELDDDELLLELLLELLDDEEDDEDEELLLLDEELFEATVSLQCNPRPVLQPSAADELSLNSTEQL
jgi:hypothetical protein